MRVASTPEWRAKLTGRERYQEETKGTSRARGSILPFAAEFRCRAPISDGMRHQFHWMPPSVHARQRGKRLARAPTKGLP